MKIEFRVYGMPAAQGSKKFVGIQGGKGRLIESSKLVKPWRQDVVAAVRSLPAACTLDGPLRATMIFTLSKPGSAPKRRRTYPDKKPDLSKLVRSTEDALVTAALIKDDARIIEYHIAKVFPGEHEHALASPGAYICVETVE